MMLHTDRAKLYAILLAIFLNVATIIYGAGKISDHISQLDERVNRIEQILIQVLISQTTR